MAEATAHSNIALIKYWGKRDKTLNLPAAGSLSLTLDRLKTTTKVVFEPGRQGDEVVLNGERLTASTGGARLSQFLDRVRHMACINHGAYVETLNNFPTSAGLASSASGFAALAGAAVAAAGLSLDDKALSILARLGSGSAARSVYGGWVEMFPGEEGSDGEDCFATQLHDESFWDLRCVIALCAKGAKKIGSTDGMDLTTKTSPYYEAWVRDVPLLLEEARGAVAKRDFEKLADLAETSCLRMHASAIASQPGVLYWQAPTVALIHAVRHARVADGLDAFFTIDAGPHVKIFCPSDKVEQVESMVRSVPGVLDVLVAGPGPALKVV